MRAYVHKNTKPGDLLKYKGGDLKMVLPSGALLTVESDGHGGLLRPLKLSKKQRIRMRRNAVAVS